MTITFKPDDIRKYEFRSTFTYESKENSDTEPYLKDPLCRNIQIEIVYDCLSKYYINFIRYKGGHILRSTTFKKGYDS